MSRGKVLVAMSGGVDSAVAAALLKEQGYEPTGVFICLGNAGDPDSDTKGCCSPQDAADARRVAQLLGIPLYVLNLADEFRPIIDNFVGEYRRGRTPNPCVHCNSQIKFGRLARHAEQLGIPFIATGHYSRMGFHDGKPAIYRKITRNKDQSYVLFALERSVLGKLLFPLGEMETKDRVRDLARQLGLPVHDKPDSQEVCFIPDNDLDGYLRRQCPEAFRPGVFVASDGRKLGKHDGALRYTIGQRRGLGIGSGEPLYVSSIDVANNRVTVGPRSDLLRDSLVAGQANWHCDPPEEFDATVQIRYSHVGTPARVRLIGKDRFSVRFESPVSAITPGQAAVCYDGDRLLGGGWIE